MKKGVYFLLFYYVLIDYIMLVSYQPMELIPWLMKTTAFVLIVIRLWKR